MIKNSFLFFVQNKLPAEIIARSGEFELSLATLIIMLSPVAPHFCSELWSGLQAAPNRIHSNNHLLDWGKSVLEQRWPEVDQDFQLSFQCKVYCFLYFLHHYQITKLERQYFFLKNIFFKP